MAQEARELICMITSGTDHELSSVGFTIANGGITAELKVFIFLSSSGVDLLRKRAADTTKSTRLNRSLECFDTRDLKEPWRCSPTWRREAGATLSVVSQQSCHCCAVAVRVCSVTAAQTANKQDP